MTFDKYAFFSEQNKSDVDQLVNLDLEISKKGKKEVREEKEKKAESKRKTLIKIDPHLFYHFLAIKNKNSANNLRSTWCNEYNVVNLSNPIWSGWNWINFPKFDLSLLPEYSFFIQFKFKLEKPYVSKDENEFYIIDNPIRKEKIFGLPYVTPSTWKGSLRSVIQQLEDKNENTEQIERLFGNERISNEKNFQKGSLFFYPTFFIEKSVEIINPHKRDTRTGKNPIYFESVPVDANGIFSVLYIPPNSSVEDRIKTINELSHDLKTICNGINALFTSYGVGAKTSSGFGTAKPEIKGKLVLKTKNITNSQKETLKPQMPEPFKKYFDENGTVKTEFKGNGEAGLLSNKQYPDKGPKFGGGSLSEFKKFRNWYNQHGEQWKDYIQSKNDIEPKWPTWTFKSFNDLINQSEEINDLLVVSGGD